MSRCCRPQDYEEDRTHSVMYSQQFLSHDKLGRPTVQEEMDRAEICGSHNDAIRAAEMFASTVGAVIMKPRGKNGSWYGSDVAEGEGNRVEVWISRGPGEQDYDRNRDDPPASALRP